MIDNIFNIIGVASSAKVQQVSYGLNWYSEAYQECKRIASNTGLDTIRVGGVMAALSPSNKWERNVLDCERLCTQFVAGRDLDSIKVSTYGKMKEKAINILKTDNINDIPDILNGQKITNFYYCILGFSDNVVIDGHAYCVWIGQRLPLKGVPSIGKKLYKHIQEQYINATLFFNKINGTDYTPAQLQAITWITWKDYHGV